MPNVCRDSHIDAITLHRDDTYLKTFVFQGDWYTLLRGGHIVTGYPRRISDDWRGLPGYIDAALYIPPLRTIAGYTVFFKGDQYYVFGENKRIDYNGNVAELGLPADIDAAFLFGANRRLYATKGRYRQCVKL